MGNNLEECVPRFPRLQTCLCAPSAPSPSPALQPLGGSHAQSHGSPRAAPRRVPEWPREPREPPPVARDVTEVQGIAGRQIF